MNSYTITILHWDNTTDTFEVICQCPIDWVVDNYHHGAFQDFFTNRTQGELR